MVIFIIALLIVVVGSSAIALGVCYLCFEVFEVTSLNRRKAVFVGLLIVVVVLLLGSDFFTLSPLIPQ